MSNLAWWLVAVLALACAGLLGLLGLLWRRRGPVPHHPAGERESAPAAAIERRGGGAGGIGSVPGAGLAPVPGPVAAQRNPVAALVARPVVKLPAMLVAARARRYELRDAAAEPALVLERAAPDEWRLARAAAATPMQCELLAALCAHAPLLANERGGDGDLYRLSLRAGSALPLARGELSASALRVVPAQSLDASRAPGAAAIVMALHCAPVYLRPLRREVAAIQAEAAPWLRLSSPGDERLRALLQDLSRYLREAEENHAGALRKPVFVARVADFCVQCETQWRAASEGAAALRLRLAALPASRPGAAAPWCTLVHEYASRRRVARCAARMLAAWHGLRLALGEAVPAAALALRAALQVQRAADAEDAELGLRAAALRQEWPADREAGEQTGRALARTLQSVEAGFAGEAELGLLMRLDSLGRVCELRGPRIGE